MISGSTKELAQQLLPLDSFKIIQIFRDQVPTLENLMHYLQLHKVQKQEIILLQIELKI